MLLAEITPIETVGIVGALLFGAFGFAISLVTLVLQRRADARERQRLAADMEDRAARQLADQVARLSFGLTSEGDGTFRLLVRNDGHAVASNVAVEGTENNGYFVPLTTFSSLGPGESQGHVFTNKDWRVLQGSFFRVQATWSDLAGSHTQVFDATTGWR